MNDIERPEFANPLDVLKLWIHGFGISLNNKEKKELNNQFLAYNRYHYIVDELIVSRLTGVVSDKYLSVLQNAAESAVNYRLEDCAEVVFERLTCSEVEQLIVEELLPSIFAEFLLHIQSSQSELVSPLTLLAEDDDHRSVARALQALKKDAHWPAFYESLPKEDKDKLVRWGNTELPSLNKINEMFASDTLTTGVQAYYRTALLHARVIDAMKVKPRYKQLLAATRLKLFNQDCRPVVDIWRNHFTKGRESYHDEKVAAINRFSSSRNMLQDKAYLKKLESLRADISNDERGWSYVFHCDWLKARYLTMTGDLKGACHSYVKILDSVAFLIGPLHADLLKDALRAASMCGTQGHSVLLKKAKNLAILLNFDFPHDHPDEWPRTALTKTEDFVKPYEIETLQSQIKHNFPEAKINWKSHPDPFVVAGDISFTEPNRYSRFGDSDIRIEQICQAVMLRDYDAFETLLDEASISIGRKLNRGHNPLVIALQNFAQSSTQEDRGVVLKLLAKLREERASNKPAVPKLLAMRTDKKKLTCLGLAIATGDSEIVAELLELGVPPSQRHLEQLESPLLTALKRLFDAKMSSVRSEEKEQHARDIIMMLLEKGADPNAKHNLPGPDYTALALAAEMNEVDILEVMFKKGGDPNATYLDPIEKRLINLKTVAQYYQSNGAFALLESLT